VATGFVWDERLMWHDAGRYAGILPPGGLIQPDETFEHPETKRRLRNLLEVTGLLDELVRLPVRPASDEELLRFHTPEYLERLRTLSEGTGGDAGRWTPCSRVGCRTPTRSCVLPATTPRRTAVAASACSATSPWP
jgi:acetoin utilization deacetylase AcuC-like enzyme